MILLPPRTQSATSRRCAYTKFLTDPQLLGERFVRYVLSIDTDEPVVDIELTPEQQQVLQLLGMQASPPATGQAGSLDAYMRMMNLSSYSSTSNGSVVVALREATGGAIEHAPPTGDALVDALGVIAANIWPMYLIRPPLEGPPTFWMAAPVGIYGFPALSDAIDAFLIDPRLQKFFPYPPSSQEDQTDNALTRASRYQSIVVKNGQAGGLQLSGLLANLVSTAAFRCMMTGTELSLGPLLMHLQASVEDLRRLADGQTVEVPALVGFAGVRLPDERTLNLTDGKLRPANDADRSLFMSGAASLTTSFETTFPQRVYAIEEHKFKEGSSPFESFARFQTRMAEATRSFDHKTDLVRLALLLASPVEEPWLTREVAQFRLDPLTHGGSVSWDPGFAAVQTFELTEDAFDKIQEWHALIKSKHVPSLDVGMRRLLSAAAVRTDPIDAFVDAVICWESIFGVQTETTFRVTASIAKLLSPSDVAHRHDLHRELKDLYSKRSRLVHGGSEPAPAELERLRRRATQVAADTFRAIYRERPDLIELESHARSARLLLE